MRGSKGAAGRWLEHLLEIVPARAKPPMLAVFGDAIPPRFEAADRRLEARAAEHLVAICETSSGRLPPASPDYRNRFDGLDAESLRRVG